MTNQTTQTKAYSVSTKRAAFGEPRFINDVLVPAFLEHQIVDVEGFRVADATAIGDLAHDDLIWVGFGGVEGRWLTPDQALAVANAITTVATSHAVRRKNI